MNAPASTVHLYVLLDRSGSMSAMAEQVVAGFNRLLADQRADGYDARMTLVQFDDADPQEVVVDAVPIAEVVPLRYGAFEPRGTTPLLDATGRLIGRAGAPGRRPGGGRPAARAGPGRHHHRRRGERQPPSSPGRQVVELVRAKEAEGWTFVFLGAGLDAYAEAGGLGYDPRSVQSFAPDGDRRRPRLRQPVRQDPGLRGARCAAARRSIQGDFFEGDKPAEEDRTRRRGR